jgi:hypothetical protein
LLSLPACLVDILYVSLADLLGIPLCSDTFSECIAPNLLI